MATLTRRDLVKSLQATGHSYRNARAIISVLFDVLAEELIKNGTLETPIGTLTIRAREPQRDYRLGKLVVLYKKPKVTFKGNNNDRNSK